MKKKSFLACCILFNTIVFAQQWDGSTNQLNNIYRYGDVSVHYNSSNRTTIGAAWGGSAIGWGTGYLGFNLSRNNHSDGQWQFQSDGANNGSSVIYSTIFGDVLFSLKQSTGNSSGTFTDADIKNNIKMRLNRDGKLIVGDVADYGQNITWPGDYRLYVERGILSEKVKVALKTTSDWSDHVFQKGYKLPSFDELSKYIQQKGHLPGIPSAEEMVKNGNDLGKTDAKLLEKIEELTLYVIQLNDENKKIKSELEKLKASAAPAQYNKTLLESIELLKKEVEQLKKEASAVKK